MNKNKSNNLASRKSKSVKTQSKRSVESFEISENTLNMMDQLMEDLANKSSSKAVDVSKFTN